MKESPYYVDNEKFTNAVIEYANRCQTLDEGADIPQASNYIGHCIDRICNGVANRQNFNGYSYKEFMVTDAIIDCIKALPKYDPEASTRGGRPNAHGYFSQVAYFAMVRVIKDQNKKAAGVDDYINSSGVEAFMTSEDQEHLAVLTGQVESLKREKEKFFHDDFDDGIERSAGDYGWTMIEKDTQDDS